MSEPTRAGSFDLNEFITNLGDEQYSPGHVAELEKPGVDPQYVKEQEIRNRASALGIRAELFKLQGKSESEIEDLKSRGLVALLGRFPEEKLLIRELFPKGFENLQYLFEKKKDL